MQVRNSLSLRGSQLCAFQSCFCADYRWNYYAPGMVDEQIVPFKTCPKYSHHLSAVARRSVSIVHKVFDVLRALVSNFDKLILISLDVLSVLSIMKVFVMFCPNKGDHFHWFFFRIQAIANILSMENF